MALLPVSFAESALRDLESILSWYAAEGVPDVGRRFAREIVDRVEELARHPRLGRVVPEFESENLRELQHPPYRIVYRVDSRRVRVVRVWRGERLLVLP